LAVWLLLRAPVGNATVFADVCPPETVTLLQGMLREEVVCIEAKHLAQLIQKVKAVMKDARPETADDELAMMVVNKKFCNYQTATLVIKSIRAKDTSVHSVFSIMVSGGSPRRRQ
jgi:hypothetical protein